MLVVFASLIIEIKELKDYATDNFIQPILFYGEGCKYAVLINHFLIVFFYYQSKTPSLLCLISDAGLFILCIVALVYYFNFDGL